MTSLLSDQTARDRALDVHGSYIVQAPAGSGKTELLSLRFLALLSTCSEPEEVLAITFTRKAASEMKDRIIRALRDASTQDVSTPRDGLAQTRDAIARAALQADTRHGWELLDNPSRLKIQTIDSFCLGLASRVPLLSRIGGTPNLSDDVDQCFADAIVNTLQQLNSDADLADDIDRLLRHLDNDIGRVEQLLFRLLGNRDQWLPHVLGIHRANRMDRDYLHQALVELIEESLTEVRDTLLPVESELVVLLNHAASYLPPEHPDYMSDYQPLGALPPARFDALPCWRLLESILLTGTSTWRATITKRQGFPTEVSGDRELTRLCKQRKQEWSALLERLSEQEQLREDLAYLRLLPEPSLEDAQWEFLTALARILTHLSSQLMLSFGRLRLVDHAEVAAAAQRALGAEDEPTDLALVLDHQICHILVDEFQDTSKQQTDLLTKLTAGWEPGDGRTLFLVGDAMQSVYGFRNANVGIYLSVQQEGLGQIRLTPLTLTSNFRSQASLVSWVNRVFATAFPARPNPARGAVPYTESVASQPAIEGLGVSTEFLTADPDLKPQARQWEAERIAQRVARLKAEDPAGSIAILVRSRSHLLDLVPALRRAGILWQATDIDKMISLPVIDDLQSLTHAVLNLGDRIAWLAILRAPWCGLSLADLQVLTSASGTRSLWSSLENYREITGLSDDARKRLADFTQVMAMGLGLRFRVGLRQLIEALWTLLGGAALALTDTEQACVAHYLNLLEQEQHGNTLKDTAQFARRLADAFIPSHAASGGDHAVHILTMHKAKGLEYDHVILPCLGAGSQADDKPLLQWHERVNRHGQARLFLAALSATGLDDDPLYRLVRYEQSRKRRYEDVRLLYIAATRARKSVHLSAVLTRNTAGEAAPVRGSLLHYIWSQLNESGPPPVLLPLEQRAGTVAANDSGISGRSTARTEPGIRRFAEPLVREPWELALWSDRPATADAGQEPAPAANEQDTVSAVAAAIGTLIHRALETVIAHPRIFDTEEVRTNLRNHWRQQLADHMSAPSALDEAVSQVEETVMRCLNDAACAWVFDGNLRDSATELAISRTAGGRLFNAVVDRTFVDERDVRWVIDYKTATPEPGVPAERFIAQQIELHRTQLTRYRSLFEELENRPVRTALLLTALPRLVEIT